MPRGTGKKSLAPAIGSRVEIPAYCDLWMRGARLGVVERVQVGKGDYLDPRDPRGATLFGVRMDHPGVKRLAWIVADDCKFTKAGKDETQ